MFSKLIIIQLCSCKKNELAIQAVYNIRKGVNISTVILLKQHWINIISEWGMCDVEGMIVIEILLFLAIWEYMVNFMNNNNHPRCLIFYYSWLLDTAEIPNLIFHVWFKLYWNSFVQPSEKMSIPEIERRTSDLQGQCFTVKLSRPTTGQHLLTQRTC